MAFTNPIANSIIKIWIKSKLPKIGLVKIENSKGSIATKMSLKGESKIQPKQPKGIGCICLPITTCFLKNIASIDHISLI